MHDGGRDKEVRGQVLCRGRNSEALDASIARPIINDQGNPRPLRPLFSKYSELNLNETTTARTVPEKNYLAHEKGFHLPHYALF